MASDGPMAANTAAPAARPADASAWQRLAVEDLAGFCASWLAIQLAYIEGSTHGLVCARPGPGAALRPLAESDSEAASHLREIVERSIEQGRGLACAQEGRPGRYAVSHVIALRGTPQAVAALEVAREGEEELPAVARALQWGSAWLEARLAGTSDAGERGSERAAQLLDLVGAALEAGSYDEAAQAVVTQLASALGCDRVSLGFDRGGHSRIAALSHSSEFGKQMNLMRGIAAAMDEARDQGLTVLHPPHESAGARISNEHARLSREHGAGSVLSVPMPDAGHGGGALTFEHADAAAFPPDRVALCEAVAAVLAPLLDLRRREDRPLLVKIGVAARRQLERLIGAGYLGRKAVGLGAVALFLFFAVAEGDYRISADGRLEGSQRRVVVAPFDGYVAEAPRRAGDLVAEGELLARLDSRDLDLERSKWASRLVQLQRQLDEARAGRERAQSSILSAQVEEARAELERIQDRVARTRVSASFAGLLVSGDLTQQLGAAVSRGAVLFELAPLDSYRVILDVDEHQIGDVSVGQRGRLVLAALPDETLGFEVSKLTPVASTREGQNVFRVEGVLDEVSERLRPGMEGVGKIEVEPRNLFWIWTRGLQEWLRLWVWSWWP